MRQLLLNGWISGAVSHSLVDILLRGEELDLVHSGADDGGFDSHSNRQQLINGRLKLTNIEEDLRKAHPVVALVKAVDPNLVFEVITSHFLDQVFEEVLEVVVWRPISLQVI